MVLGEEHVGQLVSSAWSSSPLSWMAAISFAVTRSHRRQVQTSTTASENGSSPARCTRVSSSTASAGRALRPPTARIAEQQSGHLIGVVDCGELVGRVGTNPVHSRGA